MSRRRPGVPEGCWLPGLGSSRHQDRPAQHQRWVFQAAATDQCGQRWENLLVGKIACCSEEDENVSVSYCHSASLTSCRHVSPVVLVESPGSSGSAGWPPG